MKKWENRTEKGRKWQKRLCHGLSCPKEPGPAHHGNFTWAQKPRNGVTIPATRVPEGEESPRNLGKRK
jgi:hypothetical protein